MSLCYKDIPWVLGTAAAPWRAEPPCGNSSVFSRRSGGIVDTGHCTGIAGILATTQLSATVLRRLTTTPEWPENNHNTTITQTRNPITPTQPNSNHDNVKNNRQLNITWHPKIYAQCTRICATISFQNVLLKEYFNIFKPNLHCIYNVCLITTDISLQ